MAQPPHTSQAQPSGAPGAAADADDAQAQGQRSLASSDAGLARVTEDLIEILITRGVIQFTDFPAGAQAKLLERRQTRSTLSKRLQLLDEDPPEGLI